MDKKVHIADGHYTILRVLVYIGRSNKIVFRHFQHLQDYLELQFSYSRMYRRSAISEDIWSMSKLSKLDIQLTILAI